MLRFLPYPVPKLSYNKNNNELRQTHSKCRICCLNLLLLPSGLSSPGRGWCPGWSRFFFLNVVSLGCVALVAVLHCKGLAVKGVGYTFWAWWFHASQKISNIFGALSERASRYGLSDPKNTHRVSKPRTEPHHRPCISQSIACVVIGDGAYRITHSIKHSQPAILVPAILSTPTPVSMCGAVFKALAARRPFWRNLEGPLSRESLFCRRAIWNWLNIAKLHCFVVSPRQSPIWLWVCSRILLVRQ